MLVEKYLKIFSTLGLEFNDFFKSESGFNNSVYYSEDYILKIFDKSTKSKNRKYSSFDDVTRYNKEVYIYKNINCRMISDIISNGIIDERPYILLKKGRGKRVYEKWHLLNNFDREKIVKQISDFFNCMFNVKYDDLFNNYFAQDLKSNLNNNLSAIEGYIDSKLKEDIISYINDNSSLFVDEENVICYTDMHFDNILIDDECNITTIFDFEDVISGPRYCVLDTFIRMSKYPHLYANESDEKNVKMEDYIHIVNWLEKYNSDLFNYNNLDIKLKLIAFEYDMRQLIDYPNNEGLKKRILQDIHN